VLGILCRVDLSRLAEDAVDLLADRSVAACRLVRGVGRHRGSVQRDDADRHQTRPRAEREDLGKRLGQRLLMACAEPGDRGVIWGLICADDPGRDILVAATLDRPRRPLPQGIAVEQQRDHHRRIMGRPPVTIGAIGAVELGKIDLGDDINHQPGEVTVPEPLAQAGRQQERLLSITPQEVLRHDQKSHNRPGHNKARQRRALCNSPSGRAFVVEGRRTRGAAWTVTRSRAPTLAPQTETRTETRVARGAVRAPPLRYVRPALCPPGTQLNDEIPREPPCRRPRRERLEALHTPGRLTRRRATIRRPRNGGSPEPAERATDQRVAGDPRQRTTRERVPAAPWWQRPARDRAGRSTRSQSVPTRLRPPVAGRRARRAA
jgi:hypothetical protein